MSKHSNYYKPLVIALLATSLTSISMSAYAQKDKTMLDTKAKVTGHPTTLVKHLLASEHSNIKKIETPKAIIANSLQLQTIQKQAAFTKRLDKMYADTKRKTVPIEVVVSLPVKKTRNLVTAIHNSKARTSVSFDPAVENKTIRQFGEVARVKGIRNIIFYNFEGTRNADGLRLINYRYMANRTPNYQGFYMLNTTFNDDKQFKHFLDDAENQSWGRIGFKVNNEDQAEEAEDYLDNATLTQLGLYLTSAVSDKLRVNLIEEAADQTKLTAYTYKQDKAFNDDVAQANAEVVDENPYLGTVAFDALRIAPNGAVDLVEELNTTKYLNKISAPFPFMQTLIHAGYRNKAETYQVLGLVKKGETAIIKNWGFKHLDYTKANLQPKAHKTILAEPHVKTITMKKGQVPAYVVKAEAAKRPVAILDGQAVVFHGKGSMIAPKKR